MTTEATETKTSSTNPPCFTQSEAKGAVQSKPKSAARCRHFTVGGARCRLRILDTRSHLCFRHSALVAAAQSPQNDSEDLSAELLPELSQFSAGTDIRQFLARLLTLVTKGRISPRRASVLAYITNQLLHSNRAIILEAAPAEEQPRRIIIDMPEPDRDWPEPGLKPRPENPTYADLRS
jgi:hypothetical protein